MVALTILSFTNASPTNLLKRSPVLVKRDNTIQNCDADLPKQDPDNYLNTQSDLVGRALVDMATLARTAFDHLAEKGKDSPAFQHYFLPDDLDLVKRLYSGVASNNDPTNAPYEFVVDCTPVSQCSDSVYAVTNHRPETDGPRKMTICPSFFEQDYASNAGLLPIDSDDDDQYEDWCVPDDEDHHALTKSYRKFVTPGLSPLFSNALLPLADVLIQYTFERTHSPSRNHSSGQSWRLPRERERQVSPPDPNVNPFYSFSPFCFSLEPSLTHHLSVGGHGTFDYITWKGEDPSKDNPGTDVLWQARMLQLLWMQDGKRDDTKDNDGNIVKPIRNAESFAGCGTGKSYFPPPPPNPFLCRFCPNFPNHL